ncbi:MAG: LysR family transcriptional regulator [Betaproteobacteria bacterium]|nr:LysR family transcriptional regulator [Betaproteobacteria bacterium]
MSRARPPGRPAPEPGHAPGGAESAVLRRLRLRHLELLTVLRDQPTVRGAARRLSLSQPAVSKMLREIEDVFGARLFDRSRSGVAARMILPGYQMIQKTHSSRRCWKRAGGRCRA